MASYNTSTLHSYHLKFYYLHAKLSLAGSWEKVLKKYILQNVVRNSLNIVGDPLHVVGDIQHVVGDIQHVVGDRIVFFNAMIWLDEVLSK